MRPLTFQQRFGVPANALARHPDDYRDKLSELQLQIATTWANHPEAGPSEIAALIGTTPKSIHSAARNVKRRLTEKMQRPQGHQPLAAKLGAADLDPVLTAAAMRSMTPRQRSILGAAAAHPQARTGEIAARLGIRHPAVSLASQTIRATVAYVRAKGVGRIEAERNGTRRPPNA